MRTADESQPSEGSAASAELGDGFKASVSTDDLSGGFGDDLDDDVDSSSGGDQGSAGSGKAGDGSPDAADAEGGAVSGLSETEAEDALVDMIEDQGFSTGEAQDIVDDVQADTGMTATELLDVYTDTDTGGSDGDAALGFEGSDVSTIGQPDPLLDADAFDPLGLAGGGDLGLDHDGQLSQADAHPGQAGFDFDFDG